MLSRRFDSFAIRVTIGVSDSFVSRFETINLHDSFSAYGTLPYLTRSTKMGLSSTLTHCILPHPVPIVKEKISWCKQLFKLRSQQMKHSGMMADGAPIYWYSLMFWLALRAWVLTHYLPRQPSMVSRTNQPIQNAMTKNGRSSSVSRTVHGIIF